MGGLKDLVKKGLGDMVFNAEGGVINWFPGHMAAATRAIRHRLKLADLVIEVRDSRIPLSSANEDLQPQLSGKRRVIALNKKDLANPNIMHLLELVELKLKEVISREPTLLVMVVGVPNVGKSALINSIYQIASSRFPGKITTYPVSFIMSKLTINAHNLNAIQMSSESLSSYIVREKKKRATVGPLPGVTQDIAGYKIAHQPSIYVLDSPGVLVPSIPHIETGLKLALAGSVKDSVVGEERIAQYLLAVLNTRGTPLHWKHWNNRKMEGISYNTPQNDKFDIKDLSPKRSKPPDVSDLLYVEDLVTEVQFALYKSLSEFKGNIEDENDMENLIEQQFQVLQKALKIPHKASEARLMVSKKFLTLFRTGKLGPFILDDVPNWSSGA